jgi:hypothetical protein
MDSLTVSDASLATKLQEASHYKQWKAAAEGYLFEKNCFDVIH